MASSTHFKSDKMDISTPRPNLVTTSFLLSNLHCPSCVSHIQDILFALSPQPISVSPSLVSSCVTVQHDKSLLAKGILEALEDAGFDVIPELSGPRKPHMEHYGEIGYLDRFIDKWGPDSTPAGGSKTKQSTKHVENCESCRLEAAGKNVSHQDPSTSKSPQSTIFPNMGEATMRKSCSNSDLPLVVVDSADSQDTWRASLAIGGMTCAACVVAITEELEKKDWIKKVVVNLISNSATVEYNGENHKDDLLEAIEDIGYDAAIDTVVDLKMSRNNASESHHTIRTVDILVDGMFCDHCPIRILAELEALGDTVKVEKPLNLQDPIIRISYKPHVPALTIRNIIATISAVGVSIEPSIYHPPTLEERSRQIHVREQKRILIRVLLTLIVAIPTLIIGIVFMSLVPSSNSGRRFLMRPLRAGISRAQWALFIMATPIYFLCADVFHVRALKEIKSMWRPGSTTPFLQRFYRFGSMNMLMSLGTSIAYLSSVAQLIAAGVHPPLVPDNNAFYFDSVVFLTLFLLVGRLIESYSKSKTGDAVTMLGKLRPTEALLVESIKSGIVSSENVATGEELVARRPKESVNPVNVDLLELGDIVRVLHGGSPPCDGTIVQGETKFDESSLTGESKLIKKSIGDEVFSGTVNKESPVSIRITGVAGSSMLDQIVKAVREGQTRRAPMERIADTLTGYFVPFVTLVAICDWIIWLALGYSGALPLDYLGDDSGGWVAWSLQFAIAVFVVACPCGLALAAPTALFVGGGLAAQHGILVKGGGEAFEKASRLDCIVFDKTGTLTLGGEPVVTDFQWIPVDAKFGKDAQSSEDRVLEMVNAIEANSSHTVAKALASFCKMKEAKEIPVENVAEIAGKGMKGNFHICPDDETELLLGNELFMSDSEVPIPQDAQSTLDTWKSEGRSVALAAVKVKSHTKDTNNKESSWQLAAVFAISDPIRNEAPGIVKALQKRGTDVWMLSGDNQITANAIGTQVGIPSTNIIAGVLPSQKAEKIQYLQKSLKVRTSKSGSDHTQKRALIAMVGDGINDSPALTTADVGIAIGSGSDIAISSAEFVLVSSNLNSLITLLDLSRFVFRRIKFNFGWALVYNLIALPVAAGVLYPIVSQGQHVRLDPVWASLAMAASSISVVCSSLALRSRIPWVGFKVPMAVEESG
jgi:Cu+-exporting ATPase